MDDVATGIRTANAAIARAKRRYRAEVNAVTDLTAMWGLTDIQCWTEWEFGGQHVKRNACVRAPSGRG